MKEKTIYVGSGKTMSDKWLKVTINPDKLKDYIEDYKGNKFIRLSINIKDEADQYGKDVSVSVDTWKPEEKAVQKPVHNLSQMMTYPFKFKEVIKLLNKIGFEYEKITRIK